MELIAGPGFMNVIYLLEFFDNALADIAERSDVIGKYLHFDWHESPPISLKIGLSFHDNRQPSEIFRFAVLNGMAIVYQCLKYTGSSASVRFGSLARNGS